ncbi:MAG TPA: hypothetical protein VN923_15005, partial [Thermoanaerobaculia bacterium]|nr:hypothetical protein [Thermoanaerobaculia bacterium]
FPTSAFALTQCLSGTGKNDFQLGIAGVVCAMALAAALALANRQRGWRRLLVGSVPLVGSLAIASFIAFDAILHCVPLSYEPAAVCAELRAVDEAFQADPARRGALGASADCEAEWGRARDELGFFEYRDLVSCTLTGAGRLGLDALPMRCPGVRGLRRTPP